MKKMVTRDFKQIFRELSGVNALPVPIFGTVTAVDEADMSCTVMPLGDENGVEYLDVSLMAEYNANGMYYKPVIDSLVIIAPMNETRYYVAMYSEIDTVWLRGSTHGGLVKVSELVDKLNTIEDDLNDLKTVFSTWTPVANDGGAALKAGAATWYASQLIPTQISDLENENCKHG